MKEALLWIAVFALLAFGIVSSLFSAFLPILVAFKLWWLG